MRLNFTYVIAFFSLTVFTVFTQAQVPAGYTSQRIENVNFGTGANHFTIEAATEGTGGEVQLRLDAADGAVIGHAFFHHTGGATHYIDYECDLNQTVSGTHDVYMNILDYIDPITDKVLNTRDFQFTMVEDSPDSGDSLHVYPPVAGLDQSPYYRFEVQKLSDLNSPNFADVTNWEAPFAWFTKCADHGNNEANNTLAYFSERIGSWSHTYCNFEMDENTPIVVKITRLDNAGAPSGPITAAAPHPARDVTSCEIINGDVYVVMDNPSQVSIDIDGQLDSRDAPRVVGFPVWLGGPETPYNNELEGVHAVSIFANPFIDKPDPDGAGVKKVNPGDPLPADDGTWSTLYFMPGVHKMSVDAEGNDREWRKEDIIDLNSNRNYYIPGDAIVYGNFNSMDNWGGSIENVHLYGHGTISGTKIPHFNDWSAELDAMNVDHSFLRVFEVHGGSNITVEGITSADQSEHGLYIYGKDDAPNYIKWTKLITWRVNNDGTVVSGNSYVEDCFIRHQDDANYIEGAGFRRCVLWSDVNGSPLRGSWIADRRSGSYPGGLPTVLNYDDIDVIYPRGGLFGKGSIIGGGSTVSKTYSDGVQNTGQHLLYSNINVEDPNPVRVLLGFSTSADKTKALKGIRFKNLNYQSVPAFNDMGDPNQYNVNTLKGNANDDIQYFVFDNVYISGEQLDLNLMNDPEVFDAQYVSDITFRLRDTISASGNVLIRTATNGSISIDTVPGSNQVTLTATPIDGFEFNGWCGDLSGKENPVTITVDRDMAITAKFDVFKYDIITTSDNGTISFNPPSGSYLPGTDVTVTATGDIGYDFESWGGDLSGTENSVTITMNSDKYITASYKLIQTYSLNVDTKYGSVVLNPPGGTYNEGSQVTLTPNPDIGYIFGEWGGDLSGSTAPQTITMDEDKTVTAKFMYTGQGSAGLALNCGGPQYTAADDVVYEASSNGATYSTTALISSTEDDTLYQTESFGGSLSYDFPLANGPYEVTLKFAEIFFGSSGQRVFDVSIEGEVVLDNFDIVAEAGGKNIALDKTFTVTLLDGELNISLNAIQDNAKISAIQVTNLPVEVDSFALTVNPALNGSVNVDPAVGPYPAGSNVTLEAVPETGYAFLGWTGDFTSFENPAVLYMDGNKTVSALFDTEQTYSLTTSVTNGVLDVTPDKGSYDPLEQVQLSVTPDAGYKFVGWQGDLSGTENPVTIYMNGDKNITANVVEIPTYTLSASGVNGTVSVDPVKTAYLEGDQVTLTATANEGYRFTSWSGDLSGSVNPITITMDSNIVITADFSFVPIYTLTTLASNGTITLDPAGGSYEKGTSVSVTVTVDEGYQFDGWQGDLSGTGSPATVVMNGDKNITARITKIPTYTLSVQGENGTVTVDPLKAEYLKGDQVTITATADEGYHFDSWSGDLVGTTNPQTISVDSNISITALFEVIPTYTLNVSSTNGSVTLDPPGGSYDEGTVVNLTATPNSGYEFFAWGGDISGSSMNTSITMTSNKSVIASFAPIASYTITTGATNGTIVLDPAGGSYIVGTVVTVKAIPDEGYEFSNWSGDLSGNSVEETITVDNDKTISAIFSAITSTHDLLADKDVSMQIYPNPFSTETTVIYELSNSDRVSISIYNMMGQKVSVLVNETQNAGIHQVVWDASQSDGGQLPNGIYICRFETGDGISQTMRVVMTR